MELNLRKLDQVWTADGQKLGLGARLFHRLAGVDPALQYYAAYLEVENLEYGDNYFVPTDFMAGREPGSGRITLTVTMAAVLDRTWTRLPDFIARRNARREELEPA